MEKLFASGSCDKGMLNDIVRRIAPQAAAGGGGGGGMGPNGGGYGRGGMGQYGPGGGPGYGGQGQYGPGGMMMGRGMGGKGGGGMMGGGKGGKGGMGPMGAMGPMAGMPGMPGGPGGPGGPAGGPGGPKAPPQALIVEFGGSPRTARQDHFRLDGPLAVECAKFNGPFHIIVQVDGGRGDPNAEDLGRVTKLLGIKAVSRLGLNLHILKPALRLASPRDLEIQQTNARDAHMARDQVHFPAYAQAFLSLSLYLADLSSRCRLAVLPTS